MAEEGVGKEQIMSHKYISVVCINQGVLSMNHKIANKKVPSGNGTYVPHQSVCAYLDL